MDARVLTTMAVYPVTFTPPELHGRYPHMARRDAVIWERFLTLHGPRFSGVAYDVALGGIEPDDPDATEADRLGWRYSTAAKVDVMAILGNECWLIEVKPVASFSALGQVLAYALLHVREPVTRLVIVPVVVTDTMSPDALFVAEQLNVQIVVV